LNLKINFFHIFFEFSLCIKNYNWFIENYMKTLKEKFKLLIQIN
jgi:hypothetical protein